MIVSGPVQGHKTNNFNCVHLLAYAPQEGVRLIYYQESYIFSYDTGVGLGTSTYYTNAIPIASRSWCALLSFMLGDLP